MDATSEKTLEVEGDYHAENAYESVKEYAYGDTRYGFRFLKRGFDIVFSLCVILILLIPSLLLCIVIMLESKGSPIYKQTRMKRSTKTGELRTFTMYKFRSMIKDSDKMLDQLKDQNEASGPLFKMTNDPRVTKIGKFIRKHSLDELPQFLNVFLGQMSVVGPRPPLPNEVEHYDEHAMRRLSIKPGVTGYWQIRGRSDLSFEEMVDLDLKYIDERTPAVDLKVIIKTIQIVFNGNGAR